MAKTIWKPSTILNPVPVVMVTSTDGKGKSNIITVAWAGTVNSEPPMISISIRPERYSYDLIKETKEFVVNLVSERLIKAADFCGVKTGRQVDKFHELGLTPGKASKVTPPTIEESPVSIECKVVEIIKLGSHDMFVGEVLAVNVEDGLLNNTGKLELDKANFHTENTGRLEKQWDFLGFR